MFAELVPGLVFARDFQIVRPLAQGGMGAVFVALQLSTGSQRALKVMHPKLVNDEKSRERFVQEARASALIHSDHVVEVVSAGVDEATGIAWLAMELLQGETLGKRIEVRGPMLWDEAAQVFEQLGHAVKTAHRLGLVHRDLKPENLFLEAPRRSGIPFTLKVLDFGIAKYTGDPTLHGQTTAPVGSPMWMAPEQATPGPVTPATDVWALGLIAFYVLTGKSYWRSAHGPDSTVKALITEILLGPLEPATLRARALGVPTPLPAGFDAWFAACVNRDPARRFPQADEATHRLLAVLRGLSPHELALAETVALGPQRHVWAYVAAGVVGLFGLIAGAGATLFLRHRVTHARLDAGVATPTLASAASASFVPSEAPVALARLDPSAVASAPPPTVVRARPAATRTTLPAIPPPPAVTTTAGVDASYAAYAQGQITPLIQQCWTAAQKETPNHPTENLRLTIHISDVTGRAYQVDATGVSDRHLQWCIQADIQRFQFRRPDLSIEVSMKITLTPD